MTRNYIPDCRQSKGWVIYKAYRVIASSKEDELTKKYISNRIKYPQHDLKQDEAIRQINLGVDDKVLSLSGQLYHFGTRSFEASDHDWYCYKCHEIGNVFKCSNCWRVYHLSCANFTDEECAVCDHLRLSQPSVRNEPVSRERINEIIRQILSKVSEDSKQLLTLSTIEGNYYNSVPIEEIKKLVFNSTINFTVMETKIARQEYKTFLEFLCDCEDICHNMLVLHGPKGRIAKLVDRMFSFVQKDIDLVSSCLTCYRSFYEKRDPMYNQNQCTPPHEIAFVKYRAFPLWPCKVISESDRRIQAWFFGASNTECIRCYAQRKSVHTIEEAKNLLATKTQPMSNSKTYMKAIFEYDLLMDKLGQTHNKVAHLLMNSNGDAPVSLEDEDGEKAPGNFQLAMSESWNGASAAANNSLNQMTNGNTKSSDGVSNHSFTFNGDSQNNSMSNPIDPEFSTNTPVKNESRYDKISTPKNFNNLSSTISNGNSGFKSGKKAFKSYVSDYDIKEENKQLKRRLKEIEEKVGELKQALKESYTKEYVDNLNQEYKSMLGDVKKKTWCRVCEKEAFFYCCCNIFYCSSDCQSKDWWATHKNQCFRKKQKKQKEQKEKQALDVK